RLALLVSVLAAPCSFGERGESTDDLRRGYVAGVQCVESSNVPSHWCVTFRDLISSQTKMDNPDFLLGAYFGFSFKSEESAERLGASEGELTRVSGCALTARVTYEKIK